MIFDADERRVLGALADILIPAGNGFPSASQAGVGAGGLDEALTYRPDLAGPLKKILSLAAGLSAAEAVARLRASHPDLFGALTDFVPGAYFLNPQVRAKLSYHGQVPRPIPSGVDDLDGALLQSVLDRGPIYRPTPNRAVGAGERLV